MTTATFRTAAAPQPLLSVSLRAAAALAVGAAIAFAWTTTERASHEAVQSATESFSRSATYVTLPSVEVVGRHEAAAARAG